MLQRGVFKSIVFTIICIFASIFLVSSVLAADVAYIYGRESKQDQKIIDTFNDMGLSVDLISEHNMPSNFSSYKLIFVGDEKFRNGQNIPVTQYPSVIMNYYHGTDFGLTDSDGVSQLGSTSPLTVLEPDNTSTQVYTRAFSTGRTAVSYYFLDKKNIADSLRQVAAAKTTSSGIRFGDVVTYVKPGIILENGRETQQEVCFFGIVASKYWTDEAEDMFRECVNFALSECQTTADCADPFYSSENFCLGEDIFRTETSYTCEMQGAKGVCVPHDVDTLQNQCEFACAAGGCIACDENLDCDDNNSGTEDVCQSPGQVNASCVNLPIECFTNSECGTDGFIDSEFCSDDLTVSQEYETFTCNNAGTGASSCSSVIEERDLEDCADICLEGQCELFACHNDLECADANNRTQDICENPSTINAYCANYNIECFSSSECGTDGFIYESFCSDDLTVSQEYEMFSCAQPGTAGSSCSSTVEDRAIETCSDICVTGQCEFFECESNTECDDGDVNTEDFCRNPSTLQSECENLPIECFTAQDCGTNAYVGEVFCSNNLNLSQEFETFVCNNAGTSASSCSSTNSTEIVEVCEDLCSVGKCVAVECFADLECEDNNSSTLDSCMNPGTGQSQCLNEFVECFTETDCGIDGLVGSNICSTEGNLEREFVDYICNNAGTPQSSCASETTVQTTQNCDFGCNEGQCISEEDISCFTNSDCGTNGFVGENSCSGEDVVKDFMTYTCLNPGTLSSTCANQTDSELFEICDFGCSAGTCLPEPVIVCTNDIDCDDSNSSTTDTCMNPGTVESSCAHEEIVLNITCSSNTECGVDGFVGSAECSLDNDVAQDFMIYTCLNPGTEESTCTNSTQLEVVENCSFGCSEGSCLAEQNESLMHDVGFIDFNNSVNNIRVKEMGSLPDEYVMNNELMCDKNYDVRVTIMNKGNFTEDVALAGNLGSLQIMYNDILDLASQDTAVRFSSVNLSNLTAGTYNLTIDSNVVGFVDNNSLDNIAIRQFNVICAA